MPTEASDPADRDTALASHISAPVLAATIAAITYVIRAFPPEMALTESYQIGANQLAPMLGEGVCTAEDLATLALACDDLAALDDIAAIRQTSDDTRAVLLHVGLTAAFGVFSAQPWPGAHYIGGVFDRSMMVANRLGWDVPRWFQFIDEERPGSTEILDKVADAPHGSVDGHGTLHVTDQCPDWAMPRGKPVTSGELMARAADQLGASATRTHRPGRSPDEFLLRVPDLDMPAAAVMNSLGLLMAPLRHIAYNSLLDELPPTVTFPASNGSRTPVVLGLSRSNAAMCAAADSGKLAEAYRYEPSVIPDQLLRQWQEKTYGITELFNPLQAQAFVAGRPIPPRPALHGFFS